MAIALIADTHGSLPPALFARLAIGTHALDDGRPLARAAWPRD